MANEETIKSEESDSIVVVEPAAGTLEERNETTAGNTAGRISKSRRGIPPTY